jgi:hypothetical protein
MENISIYKIGVGVFFICFITTTQTLAAPENHGDSEPALGTWTQQGTDLNGDGVISGEESDPVFFYTSYEGPVTFTLYIEGGVPVYVRTCDISPGRSMGPCSNILYSTLVPGFKQRMQLYSRGHLGILCDQNESEECKFTITDVRP